MTGEGTNTTLKDYVVDLDLVVRASATIRARSGAEAAAILGQHLQGQGTWPEPQSHSISYRDGTTIERRAVVKIEATDERTQTRMARKGDPGTE